MKIIFILYLIFVHVVIGISIMKTDIVSRVQRKLGYEIAKTELSPYYHSILTFHKRIDNNIPDKSIIFIGDSLIQGLAVTAVAPQAVNFGIGQDTTAGVLSRVSLYDSILRSKLVVIAIGINDLNFRDNKEIVNNYLKIINKIPVNVPVLFSAVLPIDTAANNIKIAGANDRIRKLNTHLKEICAKNKRLHFLNMNKLIIDSNGDLSDDYHVGDGIHLNSTGNSIWIAQLKKTILKITENHKVN